MTSEVIGYHQKPLWSFVLAGVYLFASGLILCLPLTVSANFLYQELFCAATAMGAAVFFSRFSFLYLVCISAYVLFLRVFQNIVGGWHGPMDLVLLSIWSAAPVLFLTTTLSIPYLKPEARWWKRPKRVSQLGHGTLYFRGLKFPIVMIDFSAGGAFVKLDERLFNASAQPDKEQRKLKHLLRHPFMTAEEKIIAMKSVQRYPKIHERVKVVMHTLNGLDAPYKSGFYETDAEVVWTTKVVDPFRYGLGLRFIHPSWWEYVKLKRYLKFANKNKSS